MTCAHCAWVIGQIVDTTIRGRVFRIALTWLIPREIWSSSLLHLLPVTKTHLCPAWRWIKLLNVIVLKSIFKLTNFLKGFHLGFGAPDTKLRATMHEKTKKKIFAKFIFKNKFVSILNSNKNWLVLQIVVEWYPS